MDNQKRYFNLRCLYNRYFRSLEETIGEIVLAIVVLVSSSVLLFFMTKAIFLWGFQIELTKFEEVATFETVLVLLFWKYLYNERQVNLGYKKEINTALVNRRMKMLEALELVYDKLDYSLSEDNIIVVDLEYVKYILENKVPNKLWISKDMIKCLDSISENLNLILSDFNDEKARHELVVKKSELKNKIFVEWQNLHKASSFIATKIEETR